MIGKLPNDVLNVSLETIPLEFSVVDENDKVLGWNKHKTRFRWKISWLPGSNSGYC